MKIPTKMAAMAVLLSLSTAPLMARSDTTNAVSSESAEAAWAVLQAQTLLPKPPAAWGEHSPTDAEEEAFDQDRKAFATTAAAQAEAFYQNFPDSAHAIDAKKLQCKMLETATLSGRLDKEKLAAWTQAQAELLANPHLTDQDRLDTRIAIIQRKRFDPHASYHLAETEREKDLRALIQDYPKADEPKRLLISFAANSSPDDEARAIVTEMLKGPLSDTGRQMAEGVLRRLDAPGKPLDIQFTAIDGRVVNLSEMKGKVVLVDFWATWCGPCVGEIPHVREAYQKLHDRGFEVVGISLDGPGEAKFKRFLKENNMPWPEYYDAKIWDNQLGVKYAIREIPAMWLVDKQGNLRDTDVVEDLQSRVEKLLLE